LKNIKKMPLTRRGIKEEREKKRKKKALCKPLK